MGMRKKKVRTATKVVIRKVRKKPKIAKCAICKKPLHGVPREIPSRMRKMAKTEKRPERPFGGYLCSECMRDYFRKVIA